MPQLYPVTLPELTAASHALTAVATARVRVFASDEGLLDAEIRVVSQCASSCLVNVLRLCHAVVLQLLEGAWRRSREVCGFVEQMILASNVVRLLLLIYNSKVLHTFALDKSVICRIEELDAALLAKHLLQVLFVERQLV